MSLGQTNFRVMQLLSEQHCSTFGNPTPTEVSLIPKHGKAILVSTDAIVKSAVVKSRGSSSLDHHLPAFQRLSVLH